MLSLLANGSAIAAIIAVLYVSLVATIALIAVLTSVAQRRCAALTVLKLLVRGPRRPPD